MRQPKPLETESQAYSYALRLLSSRAYSEGVLADKFRFRKLPLSLIKQVLERLRNLHLVNDRDYAVQLALSKTEKGFGPRRIEMALRQKKIPPEIIQKTLFEIVDSDLEAQQAKDVLSRHKARFERVRKGAKPGDAKKKALDFLLRKGYSFASAKHAVQTLRLS